MKEYPYIKAIKLDSGRTLYTHSLGRRVKSHGYVFYVEEGMLWKATEESTGAIVYVGATMREVMQELKSQFLIVKLKAALDTEQGRLWREGMRAFRESISNARGGA